MRGRKKNIIFRVGMADAHKAHSVLINLKMAKNVSRGIKRE